jgi:RNA polymerase alpha subunit
MTSKELEEWREKKFKKVEQQGITKETELADIRGLSIRSLNALWNNDAKTIADALAVSPDQLLKQKNFGESSLVELEDLLGPFGWPVREPQDPKDKRIMMTQGEFDQAIKAAVEAGAQEAFKAAIEHIETHPVQLNLNMVLAEGIREMAKKRRMNTPKETIAVILLRLKSLADHEVGALSLAIQRGSDPSKKPGYEKVKDLFQNCTSEELKDAFDCELDLRRFDS